MASYTYNADNLRASKTVDNTRTDFVWNGQNLAAESIGNTINTYTYDITGVHIANQGGTVSAYYKDYHGNVIGRIDTDGEMIGERLTNPDYDAFGNQLKSTFTTAPFGYCGEYYDSESGLIYLRNRYYDSEIGRFINEDPIRDGTNWYAYCENNPIAFVDPTGLEYLVVSGGRYDNNSSSWGYEFIETAIKKIIEWKDLNDGENIAWLVANAGWSENDIGKFKDLADKKEISLVMLNSTEDFVSYINNKNDNSRYKDKIKKIAVYSHGKDTNGGTIEWE